MENNNEITEDQRQAVREKYGDQPAAKNGYLAGLAFMSVMGFFLAGLAMFIMYSVQSDMAFLIWNGLFPICAAVGFLAWIAYLTAKAIITSRK